MYVLQLSFICGSVTFYDADDMRMLSIVNNPLLLLHDTTLSQYMLLGQQHLLC